MKKYFSSIALLMFCLVPIMVSAQKVTTYEDARAAMKENWKNPNSSNDSTLTVLRQCLQVFNTTPGVPDSVWAQAYVQLAFTAGELRDYGAAESAVRLARPYLEKAEMTRYRRFRCYALAASALTRLTSFVMAEPYARRAVALAEDPNDKLDALSRHAYCFLGQNNLERARELLDEAVALEGQVDNNRIVKILNNYGVLLVGVGDCVAAMEKFSEVIRLAEDPKDNVRPHLMRSQCFTQAGQRDSALFETEQALRLLVPEQQADLPLEEVRFTEDLNQKDRELVLSLISERARLLFELGRVAAATTTYGQQQYLLKAMRETLVTDYSRRISNDLNRWAFDRMVSYALSGYKKEGTPELLWEALIATDRARAYTLRLNRASKERTFSERETVLLEEIARLEREDMAEDQLAAVRLELNQLQAVQTRPSLTDLQVADLQRDLPALLREEQADALMYHVSDTVAWAVHLASDGAASAWRIPTTDSLRRQIDAWRETISNSAYKQKSLRSAAEQDSLDQAYLNQGRALAEVLLPERLNGKRLILLPDGPLHFLPFAALPLEGATAPVNYGELRYLSSDRDLQTAFSLRLLISPPASGTTSSANLIAFAPEFRGEAAPGMVARGVGSKRNLPALQPLAQAKVEVETITSLVPGSEKVIGAAADRQRFLAAAPGARILHLSAHGMVDAEKPERSFVAFSQPGDSLDTEELLYLNDLYALSMAAELTVLSACETSLGRLSPGELPLTMGGAFAAAGARSTITTLWQVDDAATKEVMVDFYRALLAGESRAEALQRAQRARRETDMHQHPYFWAGVTLQGEAGPLDLTPGGVQWWWLLVGAIVLIGGFILVRK